ncbi:hypothetical protein FB446DRAFT_363206 [Lentinula raphanica]|nr:hypothetical protein FB446DRAFT_363206 [Lentinula raphanica]
MDCLSLYSGSPNAASRTTFIKSSAPIAIPSRRNSMSSSPRVFALSCLSESSSCKSEFLFEMSPLEPDFRRKEAVVNFAHMQNGEVLLSGHVSIDGFSDRTSLLPGSSRRCYAQRSPTVGFPLSRPVLASLPRRRDSIEARMCRTPSISPPVIRTTAVHKINGFVPSRLTIDVPQSYQTSLSLAKPSRNLMSQNSGPLNDYERYDNKSNEVSVPDANLRQRRFENRSLARN